METQVSQLVVRPAARADLERICVISNWAIRHTAATFKIEPDTVNEWAADWDRGAGRYPWVVAERGGKVVGYAIASEFKSRCAYAFTAEVSVYVDPDYVGEGIGTELYRRLIPELDARGFQSLVAVIATPNPVSERLHAKFGFRPAGTLVRVGWKFGRWHDVAYWQRLNPGPGGVPEFCNDGGVGTGCA